MPIIQADELDAAAIFPQCFDNQFISFKEFALISLRGCDYKDPALSSAPEQRTMMEINRSLVYGQQVCFNRASLPNCKPLYEVYLPRFTNPDGTSRANPRYQIDEVGELFEKRALVPYLIRGSTLKGDYSFHVDQDGAFALEHLLAKHETRISFLPLGPDEKKIEQNRRRLEARFESLVEWLPKVARDDELYPLMLSELLPCVGLIEDKNIVSALMVGIHQIARKAREYEDKREVRFLAGAADQGDHPGAISREDIYKLVLIDCVCGKGLESPLCTCITDGRFRRTESESATGSMFCLKALVDLAYATNIPDLIHRFVLTPWKLPTRNALQDYGQVELAHASSVDDIAQATFAVSRGIMAEAGTAMHLPMLQDLSLRDVCRIRELPEWGRFMSAQEVLIQDPRSGAANFREFQQSFADLQLAISRYWLNQQFEGGRGRLYRSVVSAAFMIGKFAVQWGVRKSTAGQDMVFVLDRIIDYVASQVEDRVTVGPAKLLFEIFDEETHEVDAARSWSIEWMRKQVAWKRAELLVLLTDEQQRLRGDAHIVSTPNSAVADVAGG